MDAQQRGRRRQRTRGGIGPGNDAPVANYDDDANNHDNAASSYFGGVGGRYKDDANYYTGNEDREECKIWLSRSLKEMDLWKVRYMELRVEQRCGSSDENHDGWGVLDGPRKLVHFKDEGGAEEDECKEEGCPLSLVRSVLLSVDDDSYFGNKDNDVSHHWEMVLMPLWPPPLPPPPPPHPCPTDSLMSLLTTQEVAMTNGDGMVGTFFLPTIAGHAPSSSVHLNDNRGYIFAPSHATMGGLWGEEDEGEGRTAMGGGGWRDKRCPVGMDEGAASASTAQTTARGGAARGGTMCCGAVAAIAGMQQLWQRCHLGPFSTLSRFIEKSKFTYLPTIEQYYSLLR
jgi:hypothetical protein